MKKFYTLFLALIFAGSLIAQTPQSFKYQAVARDAGGNVVADQAVGIQISILQSSTSGTAVYVETFTPTTNEFGLINLNIGDGTVVSGNFTTIDWSAYTYFIKIEMDMTGGTTYEEYGTSQLLSVPYALHAKTASNTFSGNYNDLSGTPINVSTFTNDAGYLTSFTETDPVFGAHAANGITSTNITNWTLAYGWGDHSAAGYLTSLNETDPIFGTHAANGITSTNITNWTTAYGWGNHSLVGYLTGFTETDPVFGAHAANGITSTNITNWTTAYGWSDHSLAGYLTSFIETDPIFVVHPSNGITTTNITNWNTAYGWDNHSTAGYLTSFTEADPIFVVHPSSGITTTNIINWNTAYGWDDHSTAGYLTSFTETDPIFVVHPSNGITTTNITNWTTAFGWDDHSTAGYLTSYTETDPVFGAHAANGITSTNINNWNTAYGWDNHSTAGYLTSFTETDPIFVAHPSNGITSTNITNWNTAYGWDDHSTAGYLTSYTETDPQVGANTTNYLSKWDGSALVSSTIFDNGNIGIGTTSPGGLLGLGNASTYLNVDGSNNLTFTDAVTGTKTLAQLSSVSADFSNGGEAGGADRTLGNTDNYALSFKTNNTNRIKIQNDGGVRIDGNLGLYADPIPDEGISMNNIYLYDAGTYSGPYLKISGHNEARILLESRRVSTTNGNIWYLQSGGGTETYLDQFVISNPDDGGCFYIRDGGNVGIGEKWTKNRLDVNGGMVVGSAYSGTNTAPTNGLLVEGNVGIGTNSPSSKLEVSGMIHSTSEGIKFPDGTVQTTASSSGSSNGIPISIMFDDFDRDSVDAANNTHWNQYTSGYGSISVNSHGSNPSSVWLNSGTGGAGSANITNNKSFSVLDGTLIFKGKIRSYAEPAIYGDYQPRGLASGTDRNNAIEFISASGTSVKARTVNNGTATETIFNISRSIWEDNFYQIIATQTEVKFYVNGELAATHTTNIPTAPLNVYLSSSYSGGGQVHNLVDYVSFEIIK